jgi:hypothetical protein
LVEAGIHAFGARRFPFPALAAMSAFSAFPGEVCIIVEVVAFLTTWGSEV